MEFDRNMKAPPPPTPVAPILKKKKGGTKKKPTEEELRLKEHIRAQVSGRMERERQVPADRPPASRSPRNGAALRTGEAVRSARRS